jgi:filamentous hemagglutinin family protein
MNRIYRLVWNRSLHQWVVTHEGARARGKAGQGRRGDAVTSVVAALALAGGCASAALAAPPAANALPQGGVVVAGSARIGAPAANQLQVNQASQQAVINWNSFDIGAQAKVNFVQPNASASVLNRVLANDPTQIFGQLSANGQVYIVNPNGIVFGAGSRVDAGALVASTLNIADSDFMRGQARFTRDGATGSVSNEGSLNAAPAGYVALLGARVSNKGSISAPGGSAFLAAGDAVQLPITGSGLVTLALSPASVNAAVSNGAEGIISAPGGQVYLSAAAASGLAAQVLNEGQVAARDGGRVTLSAIQADGLGETRQQGLIDVASDSGTGGNVALLGDRVGLFAGSQVLAGGAEGGGAVQVGGDSEGHGSAYQAHAVYVDPQARIDASATQTGNGGSVSLWSLDYTGFYGQIAARGGAQGGNGGLVETSSHDNLQAFGRVDAAAPHGTAGSWLLDPTDVTIVTGAANSNDTDAGGIWTPTTNTAQIGVANINADLNAGTSVTVRTGSAGAGTGNLTVNAGADIAKTAGGNATLTMNAAGSLTLNGNISSTVGTLATTLNAVGGAVSGSGTINTNGGLLTIVASSGTGTLTGGISGTGGLTKSGAGTLELLGAGFNFTGATSVATNGGKLLLNATTAYRSPITVNNSAKLSFTSNANLSILAATTISLNNGATLENLNPANYTVLAGAVTTSGTNTTINQSSNSTGVAGEGFFLDGNLKGTGTVTINAPNAGSAVVLRSNTANTFNGNIIVNGIASATPFAGSGLAVSSTAGFASPATFTVNGTLEMGNQGIGWGDSPTAVSINGLSGSGVVVGNFSAAGAAFGLQLGTTGGSGSFSGTITDGNNRQLKLTKSGGGTQVLSGNDSYTGTTTINAGTLQVGSGGTTGTLGSGAVTDNANLVFNRSDALTIPNAISGIGNLTATSGDNLTLNGTVNLGGTVLLTAGAGQPVAAPGVANGSVTGGDVTLNAAVTAGGAGKLTIYSGNATTAAYEAEIAGSATSLNKAYATAPGAGTVDTGKTLNVFYRVTPSATVNATANDKVYDSTTAATVNAAATSATGGIDGDTLSGSASSASFADPNAGNGKSVSFGGASVASTNPGQAVSGYQVAVPASTANITPAALTLTAATNTKTYDASTGAAAAPTVSGLQGSDSVTGLSETYADKNAGTGKTLVVGNGYAVNDGNSGGNYTVNLVNSSAGTITPATLTLTASSNSKTYDASTGAAATPTVSGLQGSDSVTGLSEAYTDKNAGTGKSLVVGNGYAVNDGNSGGNYTVSLVNSTAGTITPAALTLTATSNSKTYDASTGAAAAPTVSGLQGSDSVSGLSEAYADKNAGTGKSLVVSTGYAVNDGNSGGNYVITSVANNTGTITPATLTLTAATNSKTYDASTGAAAGPTVNGLQGSDSVSGLSEAYTDKNAGTGKTLVVGNGYAVNDGNSGGNYTVSLVNSTAGTITPAALMLTATSNSKTYDASTGAAAAPTVSGLQGSDSVTGLSEAYTDKNAGTGKSLVVGNGYAVNDGNSGGNYTVSLVNSTAGTITPAALTLTATSNSKTYDASTGAAAAPTVSGLQGGDSVSGLSETYADKNAGTGKTLVVGNGYAVNDGNSGGNYTVSLVNSAAGTITPAALTLTATSNSKTYDASTGAAAAPTVSGLQGSDSVSGLSEAYADKNAGTGKTLVVGNGYVVTDGNSGGNYTVNLVNSTTGTITPAALTLTATSNSKTYDASTGAAAAPTVSGLQGSDSVSGLSEAYADKNAGTGKTLVVGNGYAVNDGNSGGNYVVTSVANNNGTITPAALTLTATSNSKTYDASTGASAGPTVSGLQGSDSVTGLSEAYADKNAGTGKTLVVGNGYAVNDGNSGGNYTVSLVNSTAGTITPAALTLTAATNSKTYDASTGAAAGPTVSGLQGSDSVTGMGEVYTDPNAGAGKTLVVNGYTVNDGNGGHNYAVNLVNNGTGIITPASLTVQANNDAKFVTQTDASGYAGLSYTGFVNGETAAVLGGSANITRSNAGTQGAGAYAGVLQAGGLTSNNYTINYVAGNYTIVPANELLVRLGNNNATYGSAAGYGAPTAQYMLSDGSIVTLTPNINGNQVTVNDGIGGGVDFSVQVNSPTTSTSGNLRTGGYQLGAAGVSGNSANFSNNLVVTGALSVNPLAVSVATGGVSKTYDSNASMSGLTLGLTGELAGDIVTANGSGSFASKNAGTGLGYTVSNLALTGPDGSNYVLNGGTSTYSGNNGTITPAALTIAATSNSKTYDASTGAAAAPTVSGLQGSDSVTGLSEAYTDKNAGTGKTLVVGNGYAVNDGNGGANYTVSVVNSTAGTITPAALTLTAASNNKTYDASTGAVAAPTVSGLQGSDSVTGLNEAYKDKNAGTGKTLVVGNGYAVNDGNGGANYAVSLINSTSGTITPRPITVAAPDLVIKTYDGNTVVPLGYSPVVVSGGIGEGVQSSSLNYATPDAGVGKIVVVSNVVMNDGNGGRNYAVTQQPSSTGIVLANAQAISTLERVRPDTPDDLTLWVESCADGCAIQLSDIRAQLPEICSITAVAAVGMAALPAGIDYEPASGQLRFAARALTPQTITARSLDCSGKPRDVRIRLTASAAGQGQGVGMTESLQ